jgi:serine/threonine protein kinase
MLQIALQISEQLLVLNGAGLVHADVKASNIIWSPWKLRWVLIDFAGVRPIGHTGRFSTTAEFCGPETLVELLQSRVEEMTYTLALDTYGIAAMLWTILTDVRPYQPLNDRHLVAFSSHDVAVQQQACSLLRRPPNQHGDELPVVKDFLMQCKLF